MIDTVAKSCAFAEVADTNENSYCHQPWFVSLVLLPHNVSVNDGNNLLVSAVLAQAPSLASSSGMEIAVVCAPVNVVIFRGNV